MRIAVISTPFVPVPPVSYGGTELIIYELVQGLRARGHNVTLFATGDSRVDVTLRSLYPRGQWPPDALADVNHVCWALQEAASSGPYDIVHVHSAVALACSRFLPRLPLVYTLHHERDALLSAFYQFFHNVHYIAISNDQRQRETPLKHVTVIHHGLEPSRFEWTTTPRDYVCFLGRLARVKGPHTAMDVAARAGFEIFAAGEIHPPDRAWAEREVVPRLAQPHVRFLGSAGPSIKIPLLRDARAFLAPIEWNEPFGLAYVEAMLSGCPVIAFRRGSLPEIVDDGITGFFADSPSHAVELIRRGGPLDAFDRQRCRERAIERFGRDRFAADHIAMYERVVARTRSRRLRLSSSGAT